MRPPATVGVHDDLAASDTSIPLPRERKRQREEIRMQAGDGWEKAEAP